MTATTNSPQSATDASPPFNGELFDERCAELGATSEVQRAALVGVSIPTLHRFRKGEMGPRLTVARRFARRLNVSVDDLWPDTSRKEAGA
ncbi:helix-turn-helix domain-containing protein [Micromonospora chersina]